MTDASKTSIRARMTVEEQDAAVVRIDDLIREVNILAYQLWRSDCIVRRPIDLSPNAGAGDTSAPTPLRIEVLRRLPVRHQDIED